MRKLSAEEVREWARKVNLDVDGIFNEKEKSKRNVKVGDTVHITRFKNRKVDIMREVANVNSDYFTVKNAFSDVLELKVHFTDEYEIVPSTPFEAGYKQLYEEVKEERDSLKQELEELKEYMRFRSEANPHLFLNKAAASKKYEKALKKQEKHKAKQRKKYGFGGLRNGKDEF